MSAAQVCPLCEESATVIEGDPVTRVDCQRCGTFGLLFEALHSLPDKSRRWLLSATAKSRTLRGAATPVFSLGIPESAPPRGCVYVDIDEAARSEPTVTERLHEALVNLSHIEGRPGRMPILQADRERFALWSEDATQVSWVLNALKERGWVGSTVPRLMLSTDGWIMAEALRRGSRRGGERPTAFVAMSFAAELDAAYADGIAPAIEECGYRPDRVDRGEHNNRIDDEIIARMRRSLFVVADFTNHRPSVYYEAGFAHGMGRPVVFAVRDDQKDQVHFDTRQYNHILWTTPADLRSRLLNRIRATIGDAAR